MARRDDNAGEPCGVEQAFLLIEIPSARLLRHQSALETVGKPRHRTRQVGQLLVEIGAKAFELVRIAQLACLDDLVERIGPDAIVEIGHVAGRAIGAHG